MNGGFPFQRAGALLVGAAIIGVGATKLDLAGLTKRFDTPPDKDTNLQQEPRRLVLPEPVFGPPPGEENENQATSVQSPVSAITRTETTRPELLTSTSDGAMASAAPALSNWDQSLNADVDKRIEPSPTDPLPVPVFGKAQEPELFANNDFDTAFAHDEEPEPRESESSLIEAAEETPSAASEREVFAGPEPMMADETETVAAQIESSEEAPEMATADMQPQVELPLPDTAETTRLAEDVDAAIAVPPAANDNAPPEPVEFAYTDTSFEAPISFEEVEPEQAPTPSTQTNGQFAAALTLNEFGFFSEPAAAPEQESDQEAEVEPKPPEEADLAVSQAQPEPQSEPVEELASFADQEEPGAGPAIATASETTPNVVPEEVDQAGPTEIVEVQEQVEEGDGATPVRLASLDATFLRTPPPPSPSLPPPHTPAGTTTQALAPVDAPLATPPGVTPTAPEINQGTNSSTPLEPVAAMLAPGEERSSLGYGNAPSFTFQDELILDIRVKDFDASDTVLAFGTRQGIYLPLGTMARILDLAITVSDDGHYAAGWAINEDRTLTFDLRNRVLIKNGQEQPLPPAVAVAFDGELYLRTDQFDKVLPLQVEVDLRQQAVTLETLETFPFQERLQREANRERLAARGEGAGEQRWPREETPWRFATVPLADLELRTISDSARSERLEGDIRISGDLAFLTAQAFLGADTRDGLTTSLIEFGRTDPDGDLLGPLEATEFSFGDISTVSLPIGLRGVAGRGVSITNNQPEAASVFENIDLRGILPDGYEVELYRNDILIGSTVDAVNGQFEFLQVPVDFGLNIFRLVFFGPQGQRREEVRRIMVGDGRLSPGQFRYRFNAAQKDENLFGVRSPFFSPQDDFGDWRVSGEVFYGISSGVTATASGAWFETPEEDRWTVSAGLRTGLGQFALKSDFALADGDAYAIGAGIGGRIGNSSFALDHVEYSGDFIDETKSVGRQFLRRSTELDFNTTLNLGDPITGLIIPITARARHFETADGRKQTDATLRASTRFSGLLASNTLEYRRSSLPQLEATSQLFGNFDLATLGRSKLRTRASLGYQVLPNPDLVSVGLEADYSIDHRTAIRGQVSYAFQSESTQLSLSAVREFDRFTLAFDSTYGLRDENYSVGLRFATSFGRDPRGGRFFMARPGISSMGAASVRAFQDLDGDGVFGPTDRVIPDADFIAFNQTATTDETGSAFLGGLSQGRRVTLQLDPTTLPDISLAPASKGIEMVARPGRIHQTDFAVVALSEVEGNVSFKQENSSRGVSGVRLELRDSKGDVAGYARTEIDGYYFFEQVRPGIYTIVIEEGQADRLNLCLASNYTVDIGHESDIYSENITILPCNIAMPKPAFGGE